MIGSSVGHLAAEKGPSGKGPRRELRALTSAGQRHEGTEWAERDLQGGNIGGGVQRAAAKWV